MKQVYYTQEGHSYILKSINKDINVTFAGATGIINTVGVNLTAAEKAAIVNQTFLFVDTGKKIIPLSYTFSAFNLPVPNTVASNTVKCYYDIGSWGGGAKYNKYKTTLAKTVPYIERIYYTDDLFHAYTVQYNQLVFSDEDFIETSQGLGVRFTGTLTQAMTGQVVESESLAAGQYAITITFTYFEMQ
jgi:hypothetical protein